MCSALMFSRPCMHPNQCFSRPSDSDSCSTRFTRLGPKRLKHFRASHLTLELMRSQVGEEDTGGEGGVSAECFGRVILTGKDVLNAIDGLEVELITSNPASAEEVEKQRVAKEEAAKQAKESKKLAKSTCKEQKVQAEKTCKLEIIEAEDAVRSAVNDADRTANEKIKKALPAKKAMISEAAEMEMNASIKQAKKDEKAAKKAAEKKRKATIKKADKDEKAAIKHADKAKRAAIKKAREDLIQAAFAENEGGRPMTAISVDGIAVAPVQPDGADLAARPAIRVSFHGMFVVAADIESEAAEARKLNAADKLKRAKTAEKERAAAELRHRQFRARLLEEQQVQEKERAWRKVQREHAEGIKERRMHRPGAFKCAEHFACNCDSACWQCCGITDFFRYNNDESTAVFSAPPSYSSPPHLSHAFVRLLLIRVRSLSNSSNFVCPTFRCFYQSPITNHHNAMFTYHTCIITALHKQILYRGTTDNTARSPPTTVHDPRTRRRIDRAE